MKLSPPDGTRYTFSQDAVRRLEIVGTLRHLYESWGYAPVEVPALEHYDPTHPAAAKSFKLSDRDSGVLALRADFTPALARLVRLYYPEAAGMSAGTGTLPHRFHYCGTLWQAIDPDLARTREFTQVGLELVGISNPKADAELVHLARESVRAVGLTPRVELGNPGFVRALFDLAEVPFEAREPLADAIDRKDVSTLRGLLEPLALAPDLGHAFLTLPDLYGESSILEAARAVAPWEETRLELDRLEAIVGEFEDDSELLLDLGMARRHRYYTGMMFRAYTFDFGQPLLGGGRYDGALLPYAAGFALGLERLMSALSPADATSIPLALSLDDTLARRLRAAGYVVERALEPDPKAARRYAQARGIPYLLTKAGLEPLTPHPPHVEALRGLLEGVS